jgi:hypothetical protein
VNAYRILFAALVELTDAEARPTGGADMLVYLLFAFRIIEPARVPPKGHRLDPFYHPSTDGGWALIKRVS